jgi:endonuclease/exonuclease/phosphatase family metal-dependent hydrolase
MRCLLTVVFLLLTGAVLAEPFRVATFNASLSRRGPGVLLADIQGGKDRQIIAVARIIQTVRPDILLLNELDHDYENRALKAFLNLLAQDGDGYRGIVYPHFFAPPQNTGVPSGLDLNGDGRLGGPADAFGYGKFRGQYAMALVSRFPIDRDNVRNFTDLLWKDVTPDLLPFDAQGRPFPSEQVHNAARLSSKGHWDVPVILPSGRVLHVLASHPTPPVFDGPEDYNGKRNAAEIRFWFDYIVNQATRLPYFVVLGDLNADPGAGEARQAISRLLKLPALQDPQPRSKGAVVAGQGHAGAAGDRSLNTADWRENPGPGDMRVDYVLPSRSLVVRGAGVFWPAPGEAGFDLIGSDGRASSDHRLVWVDLE